MVQGLMRDTVQTWWRDIKKDKHAFPLLIAVVIGLAGFGEWKGHQWYVAHKEGAAQMSFSEALEEYNTVLYALSKGNKEKEQWSDAQLAFKSVEDKHSGTGYALYSQLFQADVLAQEGNLKGAIEQLQKTIGTMKKSAPGYYLFKTKIALLQLDIGDTEALLNLEQLADDNSNPNSDTAAFFLGYYHWSNDAVDKAKKAWNRFDASKQSTVKEEISPWAALAQIKLSQIA